MEFESVCGNGAVFSGRKEERSEIGWTRRGVSSSNYACTVFWYQVCTNVCERENVNNWMYFFICMFLFMLIYD